MQKWALLGAAVGVEVAATLSLRASQDHSVWLVVVVAGYLGAFVLLRGASFTSRRNVLQVGDLKVSATERQSIPPWVGGVALLGGLVLIVAGARKRA